MPYFKNKKVKDISLNDIRLWQKELQDKNIYSLKYLQSIHTRLSSVLSFGVKYYGIKNNVASLNGNFQDVNYVKEEMDFYTYEEWKKFEEALPNDTTYKPFFQFLYWTGCRRGELVGLKWSDINFTTGVLNVQRSNYKVAGQSIQSKETKTGKSRTITLPPYCIALLKHYRSEQTQYRFLLGDKWVGDNWIFTQADGQPMYPSTPTLQFDRFLKRNNLKHRKFHALRHTSATLLLSSGTNIKNVASRLGHSQLKTTDRYVHALEEADKQAANTFETMFNPALKHA